MTYAQYLRQLLAPLGIYQLNAPFQGGELDALGDAFDQVEGALEELNRKLMELEPGDRAEVLYYAQGEYRTLTGVFSGVDAFGRLRIGEETILLQKVYDLVAVDR